MTRKGRQSLDECLCDGYSHALLLVARYSSRSTSPLFAGALSPPPEAPCVVLRPADGTSASPVAFSLRLLDASIISLNKASSRTDQLKAEKGPNVTRRSDAPLLLRRLPCIVLTLATDVFPRDRSFATFLAQILAGLGKLEHPRLDDAA